MFAPCFKICSKALGQNKGNPILIDNGSLSTNTEQPKLIKICIRIKTNKCVLFTS